MRAMTLLETLGAALGLSTLAGINLYLTVLVAGLAVRFHWIELSSEYGDLAVLGNPWILGIAGTLFAVQFFADKVPWVDSVWDSVHTIIRPAGAILIALAVLGNMEPTVQVGAALLAGTASLSTHSVKAGVRAFLNLLPEPVSNSVASVTEDGVVLGGLGLIGLAPGVALFVFILVVILCTALGIWLWKRIFRMKQRLTAQAA
jgi:hypothetical protein